MKSTINQGKRQKQFQNFIELKQVQSTLWRCQPLALGSLPTIQLSTLFFMDESETANLVDFLTLVGNADFEKLIMLGDPFQSISRDPGATVKELEMGLLQYLECNHWPRSQIYLNRREPPKFNAVVSPVFYDGKIQDVPCTLDPLNHPKTQTYLDFLLNLFPRCKCNYPIRYISV